MKNTINAISLTTILVVCAIVTPLVSRVGDVYVAFQHNGTVFSANTRTLGVLSKDERFGLSRTIQTMDPFPPNTNAGKIFHITTVKYLLGVNVTPAERWTLSVIWNQFRRHSPITLFTWFIHEGFVSCTRDELVSRLNDATLQYIGEITKLYDKYTAEQEAIHKQYQREVLNFEPYEDTIVETPIYDDGTICTSLPDQEPNFDTVMENDGSFENIETGDRVQLPTGQILVQVKYRGRTKYVLLDENYVDENTTLPTIIGDLERNLLHLGVNVTSDRLQRMMLFRIDFLQGKTISEIANSYKVPYHIVHNDLQVIRKIKWPDGLAV